MKKAVNTSSVRLRILAGWILWLVSSGAAADRSSAATMARAHVDYMLNCQGCHGATGAGTADGSVPPLAGAVGSFLAVPGGREFLVRVPGSANAALDDARLAQVLNWMLLTFSPDVVDERFEPYTATEVTAYRSDPLIDVEGVRAELMKRIAAHAKGVAAAESR